MNQDMDPIHEVDQPEFVLKLFIEFFLGKETPDLCDFPITVNGIDRHRQDRAVNQQDDPPPHAQFIRI